MAQGKRAKRAVIVSRRARHSRGSPGSFVRAKDALSQDDRGFFRWGASVGDGSREASQTRDYCVAKDATLRAARPGPSFAQRTLSLGIQLKVLLALNLSYQ